MRNPLTKKAIDHSDGRSFSFSFFCDRCGKEWTSPAVAFASGGFSGVVNQEARELLWAEEHRAAFDNANLEAHLHFNQCPQCGKWVCDNCVCMEEKKHDGLCKACALGGE